jgi:hypothetical protein
MATNSKSLQRVLENKNRLGRPTLEGLYLTNEQLINLGTILKDTPTGPAGVCFMIGKSLVAGKVLKTVEVIPFKNGQQDLEFYIKDGITGKIHVNVGKAKPSEQFAYIIDSNDSAENTFDVDRGSSQKTPPPFSN